jgi:DNA-binding XRE family transcriptional regulator
MKHIGNSYGIGIALKERRTSLAKSTAEVAAAVGIPRSTLSRIEAGKMSPTWGLALGIAQALDLQPVLVPRERMRAVEAVVKMSTASEAPPLAGEEW